MTPLSARGHESVAAVIEAGALEAVFQPLVDLSTRSPVGYEALARGPAGTRWESPAALFAAAAEDGVVPELDWACRAAAYRTAMAAGMTAATPLFVNVEPASLRSTCPPHLQEVVRAAAERLQLVVEVTERAVAHDPAGLLAAILRAREAGAGVALDDVGAEPASLAMMPFIDPDVIKLDLRLVQERTSPEVAGIVTAVMAHAERTGARILAEGIEQSRHIDVARTLGATIGQGHLFGRPGRLPRPPSSTTGALRPRPAVEVRPEDSPFSVVSACRPTIRATKDLLLPLSRHLERRGQAVEPGVLLGCFQHARHFTPATRRRYEELARSMVLTAALGVDMPAVPAAAVRGGRLSADDPLRGEWNVILVGPQFAGALVARDLGDDGPDPQRRFDAVITHDRELVIKAALTLVSRVLALPARGTAGDRGSGEPLLIGTGG